MADAAAAEVGPGLGPTQRNGGTVVGTVMGRVVVEAKGFALRPLVEAPVALCYPAERACAALGKNVGGVLAFSTVTMDAH
jgi:hypothetical protein